MAKKSAAALPVSANNPCPFLRALVAQGKLADDTEPLGQVGSVIVRVAKGGEGSPALPAPAIYGVALSANGLGPLSVANTQFNGLNLNALRGAARSTKKAWVRAFWTATARSTKKNWRAWANSPAKRLTQRANPNPACRCPNCAPTMDANFARAAGRRRLVDRQLMNGEWPILLKAMGKKGRHGRYLSLKEVQDLFTQRRLPARMGD